MDTIRQSFGNFRSLISALDLENVPNVRSIWAGDALVGREYTCWGKAECALMCHHDLHIVGALLISAG